VKKTLPIQALIACINAVLSLIVTQLNASEVMSLNEDYSLLLSSIIHTSRLNASIGYYRHKVTQLNASSCRRFKT